MFDFTHLGHAHFGSRLKQFYATFIIVIAVTISSTSQADNPIVSHVFTADPAARVFNDRMYVMTSHDKDGATDYSTLKNYYLFSSDDMVNWQDHGVVFDVRTDSKWAKLAYAPDFIERDGKYYLYYPDGGNAVGVAVADQPQGPYTDPLGHALVNGDTPGVNGVQWIFDPGVFIDDDGEAYLYLGGGGPGNLRVAPLNKDMISLKGPAKTIDAPHFFEAPYMIKRNGIYYLSYSTNGDNGSITIDYLTSDHPTHGFKHQGTVLNNPWDNRGNNNHHSMVEWKGQWYMFYHNRGVAAERGAGSFERSINVDLLSFNGDKLINVKDTKGGVPPIRGLNPYERIEAETVDNESGIETARSANGEMYVEFDQGDWIQISNVEFADGTTTFEANIAANKATSLELYLDHFANKPIATINIPATGSLETWRTITATIPRLTGVRKLYIQAKGRTNISWYQFKKEPQQEDTPTNILRKTQPTETPTPEKSSGGSITPLALLMTGLLLMMSNVRRKTSYKNA